MIIFYFVVEECDTYSAAVVQDIDNVEIKLTGRLIFATMFILIETIKNGGTMNGAMILINDANHRFKLELY